MAIPGGIEEDDLLQTQDYFVEEFNKLSSGGGEDMPKTFELSDEMEERRKKGMENKRRVLFSCAREKGQDLDRKLLEFFNPYIVKNLVERSANRGYGDEPPLEGFQFCFRNTAKSSITVMFDLVHWDDQDDDDQSSSIITKAHLTPLEISFARMMENAHHVVDEMNYQEKRQTGTLKDMRIIDFFGSNSHCSVFLFSFLQHGFKYHT